MRNSWVVVAAIASMVALLNVVGHWFPWHVIPGATDTRGRLRRVLSYVYGVSSVWLGQGALVLAWPLLGWAATPAVWLGLATAMMAAAGLGTLGPYVIDVIGERRVLRGDVADYEQTHRR